MAGENGPVGAGVVAEENEQNMTTTQRGREIMPAETTAGKPEMVKSPQGPGRGPCVGGVD